MTKFRPQLRGYFKVGVSGYIGAGSNPLVYTKRPKPSFARIKQLYGDNMENYMHKNKTLIHHSEISKVVKAKIKADLRKESVRHTRNQIISLSISILIITALILILIRLVYHFFPQIIPA